MKQAPLTIFVLRKGQQEEYNIDKCAIKKSAISGLFCGSNRVRTCDPLLVRQVL